MAVVKKPFGTKKTGEQVSSYTLTNKNGMIVELLDIGAIVRSIIVPDRDGKMADVALGFDDVAGYEANSSYLGATIGPSANRTANAQFTIDGTVYHLKPNDGANNLHTDHDNGWHKRVWAAEVGENSVSFTIEGADGEFGHPAHKTVTLTYTLTDTNRLELHYHAECDGRTYLNLTNHSYFNLKGQGNGKIEDHVLWMKASHFTPTAPGSIPTGVIAPVAGTPMDFTHATIVGARIGEEYDQLINAGGFDHNFVIDDYDGSVKLFAEVSDPISGRTMKAYTNLPGVQFYAGNFIDRQTGKGGITYDKRSGLCLETQFYPDTVNQPNFPSNIFGPDRIFDYTTVYEFGVK